MKLRPEIELKYKGYRQRKTRSNRIKYCFVGLIISLFAAPMLILAFVPSFYSSIFTPLAGFGAIFLFIIYTRMIPVEFTETEIFARIYKTLENLELYLSEQANFYLKRAVKNFHAAVNELDNLTIGHRSYPSIVRREVGESIFQLHDSLRKRILPLIISGDPSEIKIAFQQLEELALLLCEPKLERFQAYNKSLESIEEKEIEEMPKIRIFYRIFESRLGRLLSSLAIGYFFVAAISVGYCYFVGLGFVAFLYTNPSIIILGGATLSTLVGTVLFMRR